MRKTQKKRSAGSKSIEKIPSLTESEKIEMDALEPGKKYYIKYVKGKNQLPGLEFRHPNKNKLEIGTFSETYGNIPFFTNIQVIKDNSSIQHSLRRTLRGSKNWYYYMEGQSPGSEARLNNDFDFYAIK